MYMQTGQPGTPAVGLYPQKKYIFGVLLHSDQILQGRWVLFNAPFYLFPKLWVVRRPDCALIMLGRVHCLIVFVSERPKQVGVLDGLSSSCLRFVPHCLTHV
jgi:hypothetical protein